MMKFILKSSLCENSQQQDFNRGVNFTSTNEEKGHQKMVQAGASTKQKSEELKDCFLDNIYSTEVKLDIGEYGVTSWYLNEKRDAKFSEPRIQFTFCSNTDCEDSDFNVEEDKIGNQFVSRADGNFCNNEELTNNTAKSIEPRIEISFGSDIDYKDSDSDVKEQEIENQFIGRDVKLSQNNEPTHKVVDSTIVQDNVRDYDIIFNNAELIVNDLFDDADKNEEKDAAREGIEETQIASESGVRGVHTCHTCDTVYTGKADYLKLVQLFHAQSQRRKRKYICKDQAFQQHIGTHADEKSSELYIHDNRKNFKCTICDYKCSQVAHLKTHVRTHTGEKPFKCTVCDFSCSLQGNLKTHVRAHTGEKPFKCTICDYRCSRAEDLKPHVRTHTGEKPFKCTICDYKCSQAAHLKTHVHTHSGEKPFKCTICDYKCSQAAHLKTHVRTHTGEKPFNCTICDYKCSQGAHLKTHVRTHTGEKPFKCTVCDYRCSRSGDLKTHVRTHTGEKPFNCTICDYKRSQATHLKTHVHTHTGEKPFKCTICDYNCSRAGHLKTHVRIHTGEKPFKCTICDYRCSRAGDLKPHVRTHTGEKPLKCTICDYKCSQTRVLKAHVRTHR